MVEFCRRTESVSEFKVIPLQLAVNKATKKKKKSGNKLKRKSVIQVNVTRNVGRSLPYKTTTKEPVAATTSQFTASKKAKLRH